MQATSAINEYDVGDDTIHPQVSVEDILDKEAEIVGLKDQLLKLSQLILDGSSKYFLISVVGKAGSDKTTLVKTIYNSSYKRQNFQIRAWVNVYVSDEFDMRNVLVEILEQFTQIRVEEELSLSDLESSLTEIVDQIRYLIVFDDVHLPGAWYELERIFSPNTSSNGSRVILVIREAHVARSFSKSIFLHELRSLNKDESCELFSKKAGKEIHSSELLDKIWKITDALPLAICVLGGLLSTLPYSEWSQVIEKIMSGRTKKDTDEAATDELALDKLDASSIWGLSYKYLSSHLRACLHYLCFFPKSYEIPVRRLHHLWLAERFVTPSEGGEMAPEDRVKKDFEQLELRNMIEVVKRRSDGRPKTCRVPSSLYDTFFQNVDNIGFFHFHRNRRSDTMSNFPDLCIRRLAERVDIQSNSPSDKHIEHLHSYISFDTRKGDKPADEVDNFLSKIISERGFQLLRLLDLEGVYKPVLPEMLGKLQLLRYVGLRWTFLDSVPVSIGDLLCRETLDVKHTNMTTLPVSIWKAKTLRHLYMNEIHLQYLFKSPL